MTNYISFSSKKKNHFKHILGKTQCWIELSTQFKWQIYMCLVSIALFVLPAIIIAACYAIIVRTIWQKGALIMTTGKYIYFLNMLTIIIFFFAYFKSEVEVALIEEVEELVRVVLFQGQKLKLSK